jgi:hypothetical protein
MGRFAFLFTLVLLSATIQIVGQQPVRERTSILITGVVIDGATEKGIANAQYFTRSGDGGVTGNQGYFSLFTHTGDTIEFRMVGYRPAFLAVDESLIASSYLAMIAMVTDTLQVGEVVILPQLPDLRTIATAPSVLDSKEYENARRNITVGVFQGLTTDQQMVDARANYDVLRRRQTIDAFEKGGIPSSQMVAVSPFMIVPALYLLMNGLPEEPKPPPASISNKDLERLRKAWRETIYKQEQPDR